MNVRFYMSMWYLTKRDHKAKKKKKLNTTCKYHEIIYFSYKIEKNKIKTPCT